MSWKTIMVHVDTDRSAAARIHLAIELAASFEAHLIGVHPADIGPLPFYVEGGGDVLAQFHAWTVAETETSRQLFNVRLAAARTTAEWRAPDGNVLDMLAMNGRYADLAIVGQTNPDMPVYGTPARLAGDLVFALGCPLLIVPYIGLPPSFATRVLVGWNASREAARAVKDALPLLRRADQVTVLSINPEGGPTGHGDIPSADICLYLARHGVKAEASRLHAKDIDAGTMLLAQAADRATDLIVIGAYGHSRLRERVLGGVTRTVLEQMTVPVLMAH